MKWVVLDKEFLNNPDLSFKAKGVLAYLLSMPDDWEIHIKEIAKHSPEGISAITSAFKELMKYKYLKEGDQIGK